MLATFSYSMTAENAEHFTASTEQQIVINGHALETVEPGITTQEIQAARDELMRSMTIMIDTIFECLAGINLDLIENQSASLETKRTLFGSTLASINIIKDPAAIAIGLDKMNFYQSLPDSPAKTFLMNFMNISETPSAFNLHTFLLKASSAKRANSKKNNTIAAQHLWQTGWAAPLLRKTWDILTPSEQSDVQDLNDAGSVPFQYLKAFYIFTNTIINGETLDINTRIQRLSDLNTDAGHDLWRVIQWHLLYTNQLPADKATEEWIQFFVATATNKLPISQSLAFRPIQLSYDTTTWPIGFKDALYAATGLIEEEELINTTTNQNFKLIKTKKFSVLSAKNDYSNGASLLETLRVLTEEIRNTYIADLYLKQFLSESTARNPENNAERIAEIERICEIIPDAKQIIADAICQFDKPLFATEILLDLGLETPEKRLQKLRELSDQGLERASFYLATAYADSLFEETPLVIHLGIPSRISLSPKKRTFENLAHIHKENTIQLILLGLKGNRLAQHFLMTKPENQGLSILEKLFDDRSALSGENDLGAPPCGTDQHSMNRALTHALEFAFSVATILHAPNNVPDFFYEQINRYYRPKTIKTTDEFNTKPMLTALIN